jgi:hypothetical protein
VKRVVQFSRRRLTLPRLLPTIEVVKYGFTRPAGGRCRIAGPLCIALAALALACPPVGAELPKLTDPVTLPLKDGAVGDAVPGDAVEKIIEEVVSEPLPEPIEEVVQQSPVAPVRDEVRELVKETVGSGPSSSGGAGSSTGGTTGTGGTSGTPNGSGGSTTPRSGRGEQARPGSGRGRARSRTGGGRRATRPATLAGATPGKGGARNAARGKAGTGDGSGGSDSPSAAIRAVETIVKAVPVPIWIALGVLFVLALALGGRTFVERRRARALARDRERLLSDVAVLERALLPAVPERLGALATSVAYRPCDGPAAGGDFYDAFEFPDGRTTVLVGDVSGHGPDALEATNSVRAQLHALLQAGMSPRAAIATVGERAPVQLAGRFTTVVVAVHDPAAGTLTFATAGHPPPIIVGPDAEELLSAGASPPIGVGLRTGVRQTTVTLPRDCLVCLYTDGLVEAKTPDGMVGRARLTELVASLAPDDEAGVLLERVVAEAAETPDDMAVCLLRPVSGAALRSPRVEVLELDPEDVESGFAGRFLEACDVPAGELAAAVERAQAIVESDGRALLEVTISDGVAHTRVGAADVAAPPAAA